MLTPPCLSSHLGFQGGSWRSVRKLREFPAVPGGGPEMGWGSPKPPPHSYCTGAEIETQRRQQEAHSDPAGLLPGVCFLAWMPESPSLVAILAPPSTCRAACFLGWTIERITAPCPLCGGGHTWRTQVAEGPVPQELLPSYRGPLKSHHCKLPRQPPDPKAQPSPCTLPRKAGKHATATQQGPGTLGLELGPSAAQPPTLLVDLAAPRRCQGLAAAGGGREAGRQLGVVGRAFFPPVFSKPGSPFPSCAPEPLVAASLRAVSPQWAEGEAPSLWLGPGKPGRERVRGEDSGGSLTPSRGNLSSVHSWSLTELS